MALSIFEFFYPFLWFGTKWQSNNSQIWPSASWSVATCAPLNFRVSQSRGCDKESQKVSKKSRKESKTVENSRTKSNRVKQNGSQAMPANFWAQILLSGFLLQIVFLIWIYLLCQKKKTPKTISLNSVDLNDRSDLAFYIPLLTNKPESINQKYDNWILFRLYIESKK